ncbi:MAG TPA: PEP-CTERM sorting domain-containing protein [Rhodocyclaceae bacterium]|nr:PEP-CTERM sorting domain-containing protein [Rhodocyclaceae bacterium]
MNSQKMFLRGALSLLCALGLSLTSMSASAVLVSETGLSNGLSTGSLTLPVTAGAQNYFAGLQKLSVGGEAELAYCIDPFQWSPNTPVNYVERTDFSVFFGARASDISKLYSLFYTSTLQSGATGNLNAAGFQLALWELVADNKILGTGVVHTNANTNASIVTKAQSMLTALSGVAGRDQFSYEILTSSTNQDYLVVTQIPEPESYALVVLALAALGFASRRKI